MFTLGCLICRKIKSSPVGGGVVVVVWWWWCGGGGGGFFTDYNTTLGLCWVALGCGNMHRVKIGAHSWDIHVGGTSVVRSSYILNTFKLYSGFIQSRLNLLSRHIQVGLKFSCMYMYVQVTSLIISSYILVLFKVVWIYFQGTCRLDWNLVVFIYYQVNWLGKPSISKKYNLGMLPTSSDPQFPF